MINRSQRIVAGWIAVAVLLLQPGRAAAGANPPSSSLWSHDNLVAWHIVPDDARNRGPEARALMLERLGIRHFAYDWRGDDVPTFDAEIEALQRHGIELTAWWFPVNALDGQARAILEMLRRHDAHPQLWVDNAGPNEQLVFVEAASLLPEGASLPSSFEAIDQLPEAEKLRAYEAIGKAREGFEFKVSGVSAEEQVEYVETAVKRIHALVRLAEPYGMRVVLYNRDGWFGVMDNQLAVIRVLEAKGDRSVRIAYNFRHARDAHHNDFRDFAALWKRISPYVVVVNVAGMPSDDGSTLLPTLDEEELEMMRVIERSGWRGRIGILDESGGDAEVALIRALKGLDSLAARVP